MYENFTDDEKRLARWFVDKFDAGTLVVNDYFCLESSESGKPYTIRRSDDKEGARALDLPTRVSTLIRLVDKGLLKYSGGPVYEATSELFRAVKTNFAANMTAKSASESKGDGLLVQINHGTLIRLIGERFDRSELTTLCYDLKVDPDEFGGKRKSSVIRELVLHMQRRGRLRELIAVILQERPTVDWSPLFKQ